MQSDKIIELPLEKEDVSSSNFQYKGAPMNMGYIMLQRAAEELFFNDIDAFVLLTQIAFRALRAESKYNKHNLKINQALIGDHDSIGLSRKRYRNAKERLEHKYKLVGFKGATKGTIATLLNTEVYDINSNGKGHQGAIKGPPEGHQGATKEECNKEIKKEEYTIAQTAAPLRKKDDLEFSFEEKKYMGIKDSDLEAWRVAYPGISVQQEITKSEQWVLANPTKAKKLWRKFLTSWLQRASDSAVMKAAALDQKKENSQEIANERNNRESFFEWKKENPQELRHVEYRNGFVFNQKNGKDLSLKMNPEAFLSAFCSIAGVSLNG